ncbi:aminomethyltransferase, mitochondrial-like isoform X2 [Varroa jacobsoni]|uniref:Aminomethyltransferase n=1 Tax=Varroa destructor TaxID=109461 RepID=A0A7M7JVC2_VARDE|nr:aminomethyltransferase, mitochondrial-like [Varroa destructor]XP_022653059.1 aminomethyltransferase, mitochondrial-like [Varroa destructor]XP_022653060.1 aminomethyltransferase, mitochondrial-like [Varroa destructor]XP_022653061.1 aminomethyltransferase, mitochondrial-like [Varroa destructor]XP_022653062.1 aminomethyltransferase, mitochondrial-like [Varroa destructor]XP_022653063.1 aminomethyltransferase, mitochondrial-like [Varroa destructor]XP_022705306.1 aminomethyltransferase, mitochon
MLSRCVSTFGRHSTGRWGIRALSTKAPLKTPLYDFHVNHGGKMVPFAGYSMPVEYAGLSISASHVHTRNHVSVFDVSHMLQSKLHGNERVDFIESLVVADVKGLKPNAGTLTVYTTPSGGIIDDLIVSSTPEYLYIVSNAGCVEKDLKHVRANLRKWKDVELEIITDHVLLAVQGPQTATVLSNLVSCNMNELKFMDTTLCDVAGVPCRVTRCGYTGEDGVEISIPSVKANDVIKALLASKDGDVKMAGLGARDTLRLEAGLCLYGNDINETTSPIEAGLAFTVGKRRRTEGGFPGHDVIMQQLKEKPNRRRVGFRLEAGAPARHGADILHSGQKIGEVTSGAPSPSLGYNIAMGYVPTFLSKNGTQLTIKVRNKEVKATVVKMPFVSTHYFT